MKILLNTTNLNDFYLKLNGIGFLHKNTAHVHEFEVLNKFGNGYIRRYSYQNNLHLSIGSMTLQKDLTYSFSVEHKYFELVYVHSGYMEIFNESTQQLQRINRGEFTLFVTQGCKGWARLPQYEHLDFITITIEEEYIHALKKKGIDLTTKMPLFQKHLAVHHPQKLTMDIENLIKKIFMCPYNDETLKKMFYEAVVLEILSESLFRSAIQEDVPKLPVPLDNADIERLYMAKQVLAERMTNPPSIEELSKIVCLNTFKLKTGFKAVFADTIYGYLRRTRMEKAKLLLKNTQLSIHDIALQLGYCNGSSLSAIFKEHYGIPPKQYRQS